ncbi:hypothetical protein RDWZM_000914 [Blomia tropicalis]|uniref:Aquaporin n=1 Tax=Blomia tropicalis TaxID=40697 RepID=A0A9Q0RQ22_BLOTA|nr:hypothetical protein RDWZM_000914 [Blomia tropicalis]
MAEDKVFLGSLRLKNQIAKEFLSEFFGTFLLVLVCDCSIAVQVLGKSGHVDLVAVGIATGMALMLCFYSGAKLSGGHVNPAVTLSLAAIGKFPLWKCGHYFAAQYLGGFFATAIAYSNHYSAITMFDGGVRSAFFQNTSTAGIFVSHPTTYLPWSGVVIDQILCVGILMWGILCIVDHTNLNTPKPLIPISLFVLLAGLIMAFGLNCGPALNPARDVPARIFAYLIGYGSEVFNPQGGLYWLVGGLIAPHLGGIIGSYIYLLAYGLHVEPELPTYSKCTRVAEVN